MFRVKYLVIIFLFSFIFLFLSGCNYEENTDKETPLPFQLNYQQDENIDNYKSYQIPILVDIGASRYCPKCRQIEKELKVLHKDIRKKAIVKIIDLEKYAEYKEIYSIKKIPTQVFIPVEDKNSVENFHPELKEIKDENGNLIYLIHEGYLSKKEMIRILMQLGMREIE